MSGKKAREIRKGCIKLRWGRKEYQWLKKHYTSGPYDILFYVARLVVIKRHAAL